MTIYMTKLGLLTILGLLYTLSNLYWCQLNAFNFLGFVLDSGAMTVSVTPEKCHSIREFCNKMLHQVEVSIREISELVGRLVAC